MASATTAPAGFVALTEVEAIVTAQVARAVEAMQAMAPGNSGAGDFTRQLALAIAEMSDKDAGRVRISPDEQTRRDQAARDLDALLVHYDAKGIVPEYKLSRKVQLDSAAGPFVIDPMWIDPISKKHMDTTIKWPGVPNDAMEPLNDPAEKAFALFKLAVGGIKTVKERLRITASGVVIVEGQEVGQKPQVNAAPGSPRGVQITGRTHAGEVKQTHILGTIAPAARSMDGRAAN
jgi:hypothetical protein